MAEDFSCSFCGKLKKMEKKIRKHLAKNHLKWSPFECLLCDKFRYFESKKDVEIHFQKVHFIRENSNKDKEMELMAHVENSKINYENPETCQFCEDMGLFEEESEPPEKGRSI